MFSAGVRRELLARHFLRGDFGDESSPHSHPYLIEAVSSAGQLDGNGFSTDIALLETELEAVLADIDDVLLNDLEYFQTRQPSLENLCVYIRLSLLDRLRARVKELPSELAIRIWESGTAWASWDGKE